jgi:omega-hydroxy-beta-dihydromenaquinone-9 sulfotransferase
MRSLYERLGLGDFEVVRPRLEQYLASIAGYETNRYQLTPEQRQEITRRWGEVIRQYGYGEETDGAVAGGAFGQRVGQAPTASKP